MKNVVAIAVLLLVTMGLLLYVISSKYEQLITTHIRMQAKALFQQIVITRRWIADHGGVYVEQLPWVKPNPYLLNPTIQDVQGKRYVRQNPAMVTKQLSQYAQREGLFVFHITSLKLMNPGNAPDDFEARALKEFETAGGKEASEIAMLSGAPYFRYIAPLYVERSCLACHEKQGYKIGDVRGGISISLPMDYAMATLRTGRQYMLVGGAAAASVLLLALYLITRKLVIAPIGALRKQMARFSSDGNPDIPVIRSGDEIEGLSRSFVDMAVSLNEYHTCLQEKIKVSTKELTDKNEALARSSRSKSDFIAMTSHELRTPLTSIKGAMDYLSVKLAMREFDEDRDLFIFFEMIKKNADRLIRLVNNLLDYERIELGSLEMDFRDVNLKEVFQEVIMGFKPLAEEKNVSIRLHAMDVSAIVDEDRMKQVLTNLLSNALNFSPSCSQIAVSLTCRDEDVCAAVEDRGIGIAPDERDAIFKQFYTRDTRGGTGLGLPICKGIIESHGGAIGVENGEDGGSRFWFRIPRTREGRTGRENTAACDR